MAIYLVGDIQGCFDELTSLMSQVNFSPAKDTLYLAGDLVARGPKSLDTLRLVKSLGSSAKVVLGNHDLHLLAVHAGIKKAKSSDHLGELLSAPDADELMHWLAKQPLIHEIPNPDLPLANKSNKNHTNKPLAYMSHAGISPQWTLSEALTQAISVQKKLSSKNRNKWLAQMYGEKPNCWKKAKTEIEKFRYSINALTRMRFCFEDGSLEFEQKASPEKTAQTNLYPWFELSQIINTNQWVFGHWASLMGKCSHANIYPLDTGCVWGNKLTMLRWHDKTHFYQSSQKTVD